MSIAPISVQLYTLREESAADFPAVLARVGATGFVGVELAGLHGLTPAQFNTIAGDAGLTVSSAHIGDATPEALNRSLDEVQAVGCDTAVLAFLPPKAFADADAVARSADTLNRAHEVASARGVRLGYHNHFWEFNQTVSGRSTWSVLFEQLHPDVFAELDIYWAKVGGADPAAVVAAAGDRVQLLHVKDGPADEPEANMVAVGSGAVDIGGVLRAATGARWHIVELDRCATDMFTAVEDSYGFLVGSGLSRGRR